MTLAGDRPSLGVRDVKMSKKQAILGWLLHSQENRHAYCQRSHYRLHCCLFGAAGSRTKRTCAGAKRGQAIAAAGAGRADTKPKTRLTLVAGGRQNLRDRREHGARCGSLRALRRVAGLMACSVGANLDCGKRRHAPQPARRDLAFCRSNPGSGRSFPWSRPVMPRSMIGIATGRHAVAGKIVSPIDRRGFHRGELESRSSRTGLCACRKGPLCRSLAKTARLPSDCRSDAANVPERLGVIL